ncbi:acetyl-CoA decarbonylase/synthase complex subunit gamma [candidate division TA06 bacterium]|uniref:Acetyl-CoA decarbonylase/synthase complex subunit gamma n=1 Tax=candidate division TA06 bacterium TaxID=2250710 RepID=A0A523XVV6_UNCT6|nr:MAG: acetyl-CoA decarbonylase/synthase complex subunit gamma [candidate division TA06 bacterium]
MTEREIKKAATKLSPIDVYMLLPRTNCKECGELNCIAFAAKLVNREASLEKCPPILKKEHEKSYKKLQEILAPVIKKITIGTGEHAVKIGGKLVMYRHEFTYHNPVALAFDVTDELPMQRRFSEEEELTDRVRKVENFLYNYIGRDLNLDMIAVRSTSNDPATFKSAVENVTKVTDLPLVLCAFNPSVMEAGLVAASGRRPLIYAATKDNWRKMADLALMYSCPLTIFAPNDLGLLRSLSQTMIEYGVEDLVLDPGTLPGEGLSDTVNNFTMVRRNACKGGDELFGFPLIGTPITVWSGEKDSKEMLAWEEAYIASMLISRYADILIMHSLDGWVQLPTVIWRFNIYTDPRKPVSVDSQLYTFGKPDEMSPVMLTTNYALTYFTVESDIKKFGTDCYLIVADTEGISVESAVAGRYLTAESIAETVKKSGVAEKVKHKYLIIPGMAARLSGETEDELKNVGLPDWHVMVGPRDSSGIAKLLEEKWPPKEDEEEQKQKNV